VPTVSKVRSRLQQAKRRPSHFAEPLTLHAVGARCSGPSLTSSAPAQVSPGYHQLLQQMDRGGAALRGHRTTNSEVSLAKHLFCRFGLPHIIVFDNGTNFASKHVANFCSKYKITHWFSTPTTHKATTRPRSEITHSSIAFARVQARQMANG